MEESVEKDWRIDQEIGKTYSGDGVWMDVLEVGRLLMCGLNRFPLLVGLQRRRWLGKFLRLPAGLSTLCGG